MEEFKEYIRQNVKCIIIKGIHKVGKTHFMTKMNAYLNSIDGTASCYLDITASGCNLDNGLKICLKELNENRLRKVLNMRTTVITDFDKVSIRGSNEIISEFKKTIGEKEVNIFVFLDEIKEITTDEKQILENIVNALNFKFYLILSPKKEFNLLIEKRELLIRCFDDVDKTITLLNNPPESINDFHRLYRGHPHFIKLACSDNECLNTPSKLLNQVEVDFEKMYDQEIKKFFADDNKREAFADERGSNKGMLILLFRLFGECEKKANHFKGIKTSTEVYSQLPYFKDIKQDKLDETLNETFSFVREKLHEYLEDERSCFKLYPLFVDWALDNKLVIAPGIYYNWNKHGRDVSVVCCNDER